MNKIILKFNNEKRGWLYISPVFLFLLVLYIYPLIQSIIGSSINTLGKWNNFSNYFQLFSDSIFWVAFKNTLIFSVASVIFHLLIGIFLALLLNLKLNRGVINIFKGLLVVPWLVATVIAGSIWKLIYHPLGVLNYILASLHIISRPVSWLGDTNLVLLSVIFVNIWKYYPLYFISMLAGLKTIPEELYEAAKVDGAKSYQSFIHITLPHLMGIIVFIGLLDFIWTMRHFDLVYLLTGGGPINASELISHYIYDIAFKYLNFNYGSTIAVFMLVITIIFSIFYLRLSRRSE